MKNLIVIIFCFLGSSNLWSQDYSEFGGLSYGIGLGRTSVSFEDAKYSGRTTDLHISYLINKNPLEFRYSAGKLKRFRLFSSDCETEIKVKSFELNYGVFGRSIGRALAFRFKSGLAYKKLDITECVVSGVRYVSVPYPISSWPVNIYSKEHSTRHLASIPLKLEMNWAFIGKLGMSLAYKLSVPLGHEIVEQQLLLSMNIGDY